MAITNKEIITNQVRRINEKTKLELSLDESGEMFYVCRKKGNKIMPPFPLSNDIIIRTPALMIEYLSGVEDAVDFLTHNGTKQEA